MPSQRRFTFSEWFSEDVHLKGICLPQTKPIAFLSAPMILHLTSKICYVMPSVSKKRPILYRNSQAPTFRTLFSLSNIINCFFLKKNYRNCALSTRPDLWLHRFGSICACVFFSSWCRFGVWNKNTFFLVEIKRKDKVRCFIFFPPRRQNICIYLY